MVATYVLSRCLQSYDHVLKYCLLLMPYLCVKKTAKFAQVSYDYETTYSQAYILRWNLTYTGSSTKYSQLCEI